MKWVARDKKRESRKRNKNMSKPFKDKTRDTVQKRNNAEYKRKRKMEEAEWSVD